MHRTVEIDLEYQPLIEGPPAREGNLYKQAATGDRVTIDSWKPTWIKNYKLAVERFGDLGKLSYGQLHGINRHKPAICLASGPSLKHSLKALKENQRQENPVLVVSALHNFGYLIDEGIDCEYYLSLDSGPIVIKDIAESCKEDDYWAQTKDKTLVAYAASDPELFDKWQGRILLFNCLIPDTDVLNELNDIQRFSAFISSGGNVGGGLFYMAKAIMGSSHILFCGYDFCFDYDNKFHSYKTGYDNVGRYIRETDVYGNSRKTWQSYKHFKFWFDHIACTVPGRYTNCSDGIMGAYKEGNIAQFEYKPLQEALKEYWMADGFYLKKMDSKTGEVLKNERIALSDVYGNPQYERNIVLF